jgi:type I restriction enzyme, R subunit
MEHKNVALEVLKKLLNDEISARTKKNLMQSKSLMEMLEASLRKYHNKVLSAAEVVVRIEVWGWYGSSASIDRWG